MYFYKKFLIGNSTMLDRQKFLNFGTVATSNAPHAIFCHSKLHYNYSTKNQTVLTIEILSSW